MTHEDQQRGDVRVLDALDMPRTTQEITKLLQRQVWETWAEEEGIEIEWSETGMPILPRVRLLAYVTARERGLVPLKHHQVYARLRKFEELGVVGRLMLPSHTRSILWFRIAPC